MRGRRALWAALFGLGLLLVVLGVGDVLTKAAKICSECIGLG